MPATTFKTVSEEEIQRMNRLQRKLFDEFYHVFEPPLPEGVPERLEKIISCGKIIEGDTVLDVGSGTGILIPIIQSLSPLYLRVYLNVSRKSYPAAKSSRGTPSSMSDLAREF